MLRTLICSLFFAGLSLAPVSAQEWAEKMFNKLEHGFGTVARGSDTVYKFEILGGNKDTVVTVGYSATGRSEPRSPTFFCVCVCFVCVFCFVLGFCFLGV